MLKVKKEAPKPEFKTLSLDKCLAKSFVNDLGERVAGINVEKHCKIAGEIAKSLIKRINQVLPNKLSENCYLPAMLHDIGKISPYFQFKIYSSILGKEKTQNLPEFSLINTDLNENKEWDGHAGVTYAELNNYPFPKDLAKIAGEHHGYQVRPNKPDKYVFGGQSWHLLRQTLIKQLLTKKYNYPILSEVEARAISGLTIVADWIASGDIFEDPNVLWDQMIDKALDEAGFVYPKYIINLSFKDIFGFEPRSVQSSLFNAIKEPGIYVLEAPMGIGKTEAALYATYKLLSTNQASGLYFALPTRLTSNRIYIRVNNFLNKIITNQSAKAMLLHGQAWLEHYQQQQFGSEGAITGSWFNKNKRGILAPFGVGTIDQALLSAMNVKHGMLRSFGLLGKVVIIDECHTYDAYTGSILNRLVKQLYDLGSTVIILSATLTLSKKNELLKVNNSSSKIDSINNNYYPLITATSKKTNYTFISCESSEPKIYKLFHPDKDNLAIDEALNRAESGQRVLWIENTVDDAQNTYRNINANVSTELNLLIGLLHSRFTPIDRMNIENIWTSFFAHDAKLRGKQGGILIGIQVVEQSLDLDADFMIIRFCPTDMLLQRLGRLWRHNNTIRTKNSQRDAWLLHPTLEEAKKNIEKCFKKSGLVYSPYILYRSLELWHNIKSITLPNDIRNLIEETYRDREENIDSIIESKFKLKNDIEKLESQANRSQSTNTSMKSDNDDKMPTRLNEIETLELLLCKQFDEQNEFIKLYDNSEIKFSYKMSKSQKIEAEAKILNNIVQIPDYLAKNFSDPIFLSKYRYCNNLKIAIINKSGTLSNIDGEISSYQSRYCSKIGFNRVTIK